MTIMKKFYNNIKNNKNKNVSQNNNNNNNQNALIEDDSTIDLRVKRELIPKKKLSIGDILESRDKKSFQGRETL